MLVRIFRSTPCQATKYIKESSRRMVNTEKHTPNPEPWYGVRLLYQLTGIKDLAYEERIVIVRASDEDTAIAVAEENSRNSYEDSSTLYTGYAMCFNIFDECGDSLAEGVEVFSLIRNSKLDMEAYIDRFHDTGNECARSQ